MTPDHPAIAALAARLGDSAERGPGDAYYRLSCIVARVLVSQRLRQRQKWCALARQLAQNPGVENRLVMQAMRWLRQGQPIDLKRDIIDPAARQSQHPDSAFIGQVGDLLRDLR